MKFLLFIIGIAFISIETSCQTVDFEFFETSERKTGKQYAKALIPARIDSVPFYNRYNYPIYELQTVETIDTVYFSNFMVLKEADHFNEIAHLVDTTHRMFQLADPTSVQHIEGCNHNYEWITEQVEKIPGFKSWILTADQHQISSNDWAIRPIMNYRVQSGMVVKNPCSIRETTYPTPYTNLIRIFPKRTLTFKEQSFLERYTKDYVTYSNTYHCHTKRIEKTTIKEEYKYSLTKEACIEAVEVYSAKEIKRLLPGIKSKLLEMELLSINDCDLECIQKALLQFQFQHGFPIGQYDKESVDGLLKR